MILNANLKQFFLCELMNRDVFIFYLLCTFIYFVVSVWFQLIFVTTPLNLVEKALYKWIIIIIILYPSYLYSFLGSSAGARTIHSGVRPCTDNHVTTKISESV